MKKKCILVFMIVLAMGMTACSSDSKENTVAAETNAERETENEDVPQAEGDFIIRIKNKAFNIYDADSRKLDLTDWLRTVGETAKELNVFIRNSEKSWFR